ncbi:MAG TPA: hypothetical protein VGZ32_27495 [Actinocrinis sp.]|jgi:hypothetical protein|uniref:hypothetical protein n=1 Tax=Actinocrinis sp. TaxID=1920516 RepID=UPI002DDD2033|nr:hypothetical protein [Actinocrinis sp.]HEV3174124.1 hypothetical protein [Actinocrinis sp.]
MSETDESGGGSWFDGVEHTVDGALEATGHFIESTGEEAASAFEAAGATAEDAAKLVASDADVIPGISEVAGVLQTGYHAGAAIGSAIEGDWDGAADHALSMAEAAGNVATYGGLGLAEGAWDLTNAADGGGESTDAHHTIQGALQTAGNWLGDTAYNLINGDDSSTGGTGSSGDDSSAQSSSGGDPGSSGDAGAYGDESGADGGDVPPSE